MINDLIKEYNDKFNYLIMRRIRNSEVDYIDVAYKSDNEDYLDFIMIDIDNNYWLSIKCGNLLFNEFSNEIKTFKEFYNKLILCKH